MKRLIRDLILSVGALASFVGLVLAVRPPGQPWTFGQVVLFILACLLGLIALGLDVHNYLSKSIKYFKGSTKIYNYMYAWISGASGVAIFSRDLSWVSTVEMKNLLQQKARDAELTLILPKEIPVSEELRSLGAEVHYYKKINYVIKSRFTIINTNRADSQVAIGYSQGGRHRVEELTVGSDPAYHLAQDMLELVKGFTKVRAS